MGKVKARELANKAAGKYMDYDLQIKELKAKQDTEKATVLEYVEANDDKSPLAGGHVEVVSRQGSPKLMPRISGVTAKQLEQELLEQFRNDERHAKFISESIDKKRLAGELEGDDGKALRELLYDSKLELKQEKTISLKIK